jgi:hypothetical protein
MRIRDLVRVVWHRPLRQGLSFAFTLGVLIPLAMSLAGGETVRPSATAPSWTTPMSGGADA